MAEQRLSTPAAIVIAGGMIAVAVFFGLRGQRREAGPAPEVIAVAASARAPVESPAAARVPAPARVPADVVVQQIAAQLATQKPAMVEKCWKPNATATPPPRPARYTFEFTIGAGGEQLGRGVREDRGTGSAEITRCVLGLITPVTIAPPGTSTTVDVPFALP